MELILFALVASVIFLAIVFEIEPAGVSRVCTFALAVALFGACGLGFGAFMLGVMTLVVCPIAARLDPERPHVCTWAAGVALVVTWLFALGAVAIKWYEVESLVAKYPMESLSARLAYEQRPATGEHALLKITDRMEHRLERRDRPSLLTYDRQHVLEELHSGVRLKFVASAGFGVGRMGSPGMSLWRVRVPDSRPLRLPKPTDPSASPEPGQLAAAGETRPLGPEKLLEWHTCGERQFVDPERNGYIRSRDEVAGFVPHRFGYLPSEDEHWQVVRLELISLLKHERPVAYVSENLPDMSQVEKYATRELDAFETSALAKLRTEEDLVVEEQPSRIRMVGSLRAGKTCLACHSVQRGELLGAFTYLLERKSRPPAKPSTPPREPSA